MSDAIALASGKYISLTFDIFDGLLPIAFVLGDVALQLIGDTSKFSTLAITCAKLCFAVLILIYISYLYFVRGEKERTSNNIVDMVTIGVVVLILIITITIIIVKIKNEQEDDSKNQITSEAI
jgi:L-asparagine transporter-like permease